MGNLRVKDDQSRLVGVGDVGVGLRADVDAGEVAPGAGLALQSADDLGPDIFLVQPLGLVLGSPGDVGLQVVPVLAGAGVEVGGAVAELRERGVEVTGHVTGDCGAQEDPLCL